MKNIWRLFRMQLDERTNLFRRQNKKVMLKTLLLYVLVVTVATVVIRVLVEDMLGLGIIFGRDMFALVLLVVQAISVFLTLTKTINTLYTNKDNDLLMSFPVTPNQVFVSKLLVIYVTDFISNVLYTLPIFLTFSICGKMGAIFELTFIPMLLVLPLLSLAISVFLSLPVFMVSKFFKKHTIIAVIFILAVSALGIYFYSSVVTDLTSIMDLTGNQTASITSFNSKITSTAHWNRPFIFVAEAMMFNGFGWRYLTIFGVSFVILALGLLISAPFYFKLAMSSNEGGIDSKDFVNKDKGIHKAIPSLFVKEFKTTFRSPGYIFQYFIFTLLMPIIVPIYDKIMFNVTLSSLGQNMVDGVHLIVLGLIAMMSNIVSTSAISREGSNFYFMKIAPISTQKQCFVKITFNAILTITAIILTNVLCGIFFDFAWWKIVLQIIALSVASIGHICLCFTFDMMKPSLDWFDSNEIESLSNSAIKGMVVGLLIAGFLGLILLLNAGNLLKAYMLLVIGSIAFTACCIHMLRIRISYYFKKMEV